MELMTEGTCPEIPSVWDQTFDEKHIDSHLVAVAGAQCEDPPIPDQNCDNPNGTKINSRDSRQNHLTILVVTGFQV